jgi:glucan 1,3-beta-glucosidase
MAGEFSTGFNDCGLYLKGVPGTSHSYGGDCSVWQDSSNWTPGTKAGIMNLALASMDTFQDWFFWTWKVGYILFPRPVGADLTPTGPRWATRAQA